MNYDFCTSTQDPLSYFITASDTFKSVPSDMVDVCSQSVMRNRPLAIAFDSRTFCEYESYPHFIYGKGDVRPHCGDCVFRAFDKAFDDDVTFFTLNQSQLKRW